MLLAPPRGLADSRIGYIAVFLLTTQDSPFGWDRIFVRERTRHPISGSSTRPMSHDVVVHIFDLLNFAECFVLTKRVVL